MISLAFTQMSLDSFDWSFLDESQEGIDKFVGNLFSFHVLLFKNDDFDMRVIELTDAFEVEQCIKDNFTSTNTTQLILANGTSRNDCPFFRVVMQDYSPKNVINYKLETFFRSTGILGVHARCSIALVVGLCANDPAAAMIGIPSAYRVCPIKNLELLSPIDLTCTQSEVRKVALDRLMSIPGMSLPVVLPREVHFKIFGYLRHPCAQLILDHRRQLLQWINYWDEHFACVVRSFGSW